MPKTHSIAEISARTLAERLNTAKSCRQSDQPLVQAAMLEAIGESYQGMADCKPSKDVRLKR
jgi:hypothetical protein